MWETNRLKRTGSAAPVRHDVDDRRLRSFRFKDRGRSGHHAVERRNDDGQPAEVAVLHRAVVGTCWLLYGEDGYLGRCIAAFHDVARTSVFRLPADHAHDEVRAAGAQAEMDGRRVEQHPVPGRHGTRQIVVTHGPRPPSVD